MTEASHEVQVVVAEGEGIVNGDFVAFQITASLQVFKVRTAVHVGDAHAEAVVVRSLTFVTHVNGGRVGLVGVFSSEPAVLHANPKSVIGVAVNKRGFTQTTVAAVHLHDGVVCGPTGIIYANRGGGLGYDHTINEPLGSALIVGWIKVVEIFVAGLDLIFESIQIFLIDRIAVDVKLVVVERFAVDVHLVGEGHIVGIILSQREREFIVG